MTIEDMIAHLERNGYKVVPSERIKTLVREAKVGRSEDEGAAQSRMNRVKRELSRDIVPLMVVGHDLENDGPSIVSARITVIVGESA